MLRLIKKLHECSLRTEAIAEGELKTSPSSHFRRHWVAHTAYMLKAEAVKVQDLLAVSKHQFLAEVLGLQLRGGIDDERYRGVVTRSRIEDIHLLNTYMKGRWKVDDDGSSRA
jgi:hypothetical protein